MGAAEQKKDEAAQDENEGYWLSMQVRNNKKTAILALMDETSKKGKNNKKPDSKLFYVYRPNTGQQVKQETLGELRKKYKSNEKSEFCQICISSVTVVDTLRNLSTLLLVFPILYPYFSDVNIFPKLMSSYFPNQTSKFCHTCLCNYHNLK